MQNDTISRTEAMRQFTNDPQEQYTVGQIVGVLDAMPVADAVEVVQIDALIEKYQKEADKFFALAKHYYGDGATIDRYKWTHSLASTYRNFVNDLDSICCARMDGQRRGDGEEDG